MLNRIATVFFAVLVAAVFCVLPAAAQQYDRNTLGAGKILYMRCISCHTITKNGGHLAGPNLWGLMGARAGIKEGFKGYSVSLLESDIFWSREALDKYIQDPKSFLPGTNMIYNGLPKKKDRFALIAYIETESARDKAQYEGLRY